MATFPSPAMSSSSFVGNGNGYGGGGQQQQQQHLDAAAAAAYAYQQQQQQMQYPVSGVAGAPNNSSISGAAASPINNNNTSSPTPPYEQQQQGNPPSSQMKLKKSCERCARSKVRCDGNCPCAKCLKHGKECYFVPESKRGRRRKTAEESGAAGSGGQGSGGDGDDEERGVNDPSMDNTSLDAAGLPKKRKRRTVTNNKESARGNNNDGRSGGGAQQRRRVDPGTTWASPQHQPYSTSSDGSMMGRNPSQQQQLQPYNQQQLAGNSNNGNALGGVTSAADECWNSCSLQVPQSVRLSAPDSFQSLDHRVKEYERRLLRVFFALYKHHLQESSSCCRMWFSHQINKIWSLWNAKGIYKKSEHAQFMKWIADHNLTASGPSAPFSNVPLINPIEEETGRLLPPTLGAKGPKFVDVVALKKKKPSLNMGKLTLLPSTFVGGGVAQSSPQHHGGHLQQLPPTHAIGVPPPMFHQADSANYRNANDPQLNKNIPFICVLTAHEGSICDCNEAFVRLTGFNAQDAMGLTYWTRDGFLPWGGDLIAMIADSDEATLNYLRLCSQHFAQVGRPASFPATRSVQLAVEGAIVTKQGIRIPNLLLSVTINEFLSLGRTQVDVMVRITSVPGTSSAALVPSLAPGALMMMDTMGAGGATTTGAGASGQQHPNATTHSNEGGGGQEAWNGTLDAFDVQDIWNLDDLPWAKDMPGLPPAVPTSSSSSGNGSSSSSSTNGASAAVGQQQRSTSSTPYASSISTSSGSGSMTTPPPFAVVGGGQQQHINGKPDEVDDGAWLSSLLDWVDKE